MRSNRLYMFFPQLRRTKKWGWKRGTHRSFGDTTIKNWLKDVFFFAEDIFGGQFCIKSGEVYTFDPETSRKEHLAHNLEGWAQAVLADYEMLTGYPLAHKWQQIHGPLPNGKRLVPKIFFVTGGEFSVSNLYLLDSVQAMQLRGNIAVQIKDLPDGQTIKIKLTD